MKATLPATYGGTGWRPRMGTHRDDVDSGTVWRSCGSCSEVEELREVMLVRPRPAWFEERNPDDWLFLENPDPIVMKRQAVGIAEAFARHGVNVLWSTPARASPNFIFQRDLFFMTPEGAVVARPASQQRASEVRLAAAQLTRRGIPIIGMPRGEATFEGADALWLNDGHVLIGTGRRTNSAGAAYVSSILGDMSVKTTIVEIPSTAQHLLGVVNFISDKLAAIRSDRATDELLSVLRCAGVELVTHQPRDTIGDFAMNYVTIRPAVVVMPAGYPSFRDRLKEAGVEVCEVRISEYCKAAGGLACITGIVHRAHCGRAERSRSGASESACRLLGHAE